MPRPARQYVFRARRDRQRIAQRLASGMGREAVAAVERCEVEAIDRLMGDRAFQGLVEAYEELLSASPEERHCRLVALAKEILLREMMAGNTFAAAFLLHLHEQGRDPYGTLAEAVETALMRARQGRGPNRVERGSLTGPEPDPRTPADAVGRLQQERPQQLLRRKIRPKIRGHVTDLRRDVGTRQRDPATAPP